MTIGTHIIVDQDIDKAVTLLLMPYGIKNILVLVIGRNEFIIITINQILGIIFNNNSIEKNIIVIIGVIIIVRKSIFLTQIQ
jgi:hypothetical protein